MFDLIGCSFVKQIMFEVRKQHRKYVTPIKSYCQSELGRKKTD